MIRLPRAALVIVVVTSLAVAGMVALDAARAARADVISYEQQVIADQPLYFFPFDESSSSTTFANVMHPSYATAVGGDETTDLSPFGPNNGDGRVDRSLPFSGGTFSGTTPPRYAVAPQMSLP